MNDLIEALQILAKYQKPTRWPTHCEHDVLYVMDVKKGAPSAEERIRLDELGFLWMDSEECWGSFRYGSA
jgi:hypothetical protein